MAKKFDFIVIGGGLVGCMACLSISNSNKSVCLIEKNKFNKIVSNDYSPLSLSTIFPNDSRFISLEDIFIVLKLLKSLIYKDIIGLLLNKLASQIFLSLRKFTELIDSDNG